MITQVTNEEEYLAALQHLYLLMDAQPNTPEEVELDELADLVCAYEDIHYPIAEPSLEEAAKFRADQEVLRWMHYDDPKSKEEIERIVNG
jgi:antitoxin component HigA of HigAB toxin-antitoxin module